MQIEYKIDNKKYTEILNSCVNVVIKNVSRDDLEGIDRILFLDNDRNEKEYDDAGGIYFLERDNKLPYIELYLQRILNGMPTWIPPKWIFLKYSVVRMILHEIGHHVNRNYAYERNEAAWERASMEYASKYLWKIYGLWMCLFLTIGSLSGELLK